MIEQKLRLLTCHFKPETPKKKACYKLTFESEGMRVVYEFDDKDFDPRKWLPSSIYKFKFPEFSDVTFVPKFTKQNVIDEYQDWDGDGD